jgi:pilus assembly protein TadC
VTPVTLLSLAWMALVLAGGWRWRPDPHRVRALVGVGLGAADRHRRVVGRATPTVRQLPVRVGTAVLRRLGRPPDPVRAKRVGDALLAGSVALPVLPIAALPLGLMVWAAPGMKAQRRERQRLATLAADLPDVVDLLVLAVGAGLTVQLAVRSVARRAPGPLGAELARACAEASLGRRLGDALDDLPDRAGEACRPLVAALLASERYGAPLGPGLERLAHEVRADRRRRAEEAARKIPVKLLFPLVSCTLPAFALLTVAPLIASAVRSLRL